MKRTLTIVGGTYWEVCIEPKREPELYGSGFRAAAALSEKEFNVELHTCIGKLHKSLLASFAEAFGIKLKSQIIEKTVTFGYYHPLAIPECINPNDQIVAFPPIESDFILYYGLVEANAAIRGNYVVHDPQNQILFSATGSTANHLAIVLNRKEAYILSESEESIPLKEVGQSLLASQAAEVVVIKNGSCGALVVDANGACVIPVFQTETVWPIGSGDVFSAVFAWQWAINKRKPCDAALLASQYTATFCNSNLLPLADSPDEFTAIQPRDNRKKIYLAGPFFTMGQRWLVNEFRLLLLEFGNEVFSPYHELGLATPEKKIFTTTDYQLAKEDLKAIHDADLVFAILCDHDPGTVFEIGYARALGKDVLIYSENLQQEDLFMMVGSECKVIPDFSTAIYAASW